MEREKRTALTEFEMRGQRGAGAVISGYASVFNSETDLGLFREQVAPGTFKKSIKERDIRALVDHASAEVVGRSKKGPANLRLVEDATGLYHELEVPDTRRALELYDDIQQGLIDSMSFAFETVRDAWDYPKDALPLRTLKEVRLWEVSYVTFPAYEDTSAVARAAFRSIADTANRPLDELIEAAQGGTLLSLLVRDEQPPDAPQEAPPVTPSTWTPDRTRLALDELDLLVVELGLY